MALSSIARPTKVALLGFVLGLLAYAGFYAWQTWEGIRQRESASLSQLSHYSAYAADAYFSDMYGDIRMLAKEIGGAQALADRAHTRALLQSFLTLHPALLAVNLVAPDGAVLLSTRFASDAMVPRVVHGFPWGFAEALKQRGLSIGLPLLGPYTHHWVLPLRYAVRDTSGRVLYVLGVVQTLRSQQHVWRQLPLQSYEHIGILRSDGYMESVWPAKKRYLSTRVYGLIHRGILTRELTIHPHRATGAFYGRAAPVTLSMMGSYTRLPHFPNYTAFVVIPVAVLWAHWLRAVGWPFLLVFVLIAAGMLTHLWIEHRLRQWERERENAVAREMRLRDFYAALSEINQLIAHHPDPMQLFASVCEIVVTHTYLKLAWIGLVDPVSQAPRIVASSGVAKQYVDGLQLSVDPQVPEGRGPFGRTMRSEENLVIQDIAHEPGFEPWRDRAARFGLVSSASFPFRRQGRVTGVMTVYSGAAGFFEPELARLLEELAVDVSFSLEDYDRQQELLRLALHDNLTGLANRQLFLDRLHQALGLARRDERLVAVGIVDLDGFKQINDRLGHAAGDEVLKQVAKRLLGSLRETDTLARLGGDEFGLILSGLCNVQEMHSVLHRCITAVASPVTLSGAETIALSASIGVAVYPFDDGEISGIVRHADLALYRAKESGGNGFALFEQPLEDEMLERHRARAEIQNAFRRREFVIHYQPQVDMGSGQVLGVEALARWAHPTRGLLMPDQFIQVIEEDVHFIRGLGRFVLEETCRQYRLWAAAGLNLKVSVNIGARHLLAPEFLGDIGEVLARHGDAAAKLLLEVTESDALADMEQSAQVLKECRSRGLKIAIDDFGSGYASLTYLQRLPVDQIKIDQGFVRGLLDDTRNIAIVASLISAARLLGIQTVAEGVESEEHGNLLLKLGCPVAQGYAIAHAMPAESIPGWIAQWRPSEHWMRVAQHPYTSENMGLLMLLMQHERQMREIIRSLTQSLDRAVDVGPQDFHCVIEDWYQQDGLRLYGHLPEFGAIRDAYQRLCVEVQQVLRDGEGDSGLSRDECSRRLRALDGRLQREFEQLLQ